MAPFAALTRFDAQLLVVAGSRDQVCPRASLDELSGHLRGALMTVVDGADHFFFGKLFALGEALGGWAARLLEPGQARRRGSAG